MADLDHFKRINDTHGHPAGDAVLREIACRMRSAVRPYDSVGRYGGEEFLIVVPECNSTGAAHQAERLRRCVVGEPVRLGESSLAVTVSLGVASTGEPRPSEWGVLLRAADAALYVAKASGRNRVEVAATLPVLSRPP